MIRRFSTKHRNEHTNVFNYFDKSAKSGNAEGMYEMSKMILFGSEYTKKNGFDKSDKFLVSNKCTNETASRIKEDKSKKEILQYYKKEADKGKVEAMYQ